MSESINGIAISLFCHYGETDDAFLIGGLVEPNETLMASAIRHVGDWSTSASSLTIDCTWQR